MPLSPEDWRREARRRLPRLVFDYVDRAAEGEQWMRLDVMHREMAERIVRRAARAGYRALVLTVDVPVNGNRELHLRNGFGLPSRPTPQLALEVASHPRWALRLSRRGAPDFANLLPDEGEPASAALQAALLVQAMDRTLVWEHLAWLQALRNDLVRTMVLLGARHAEELRRMVA